MLTPEDGGTRLDRSEDSIIQRFVVRVVRQVVHVLEQRGAIAVAPTVTCETGRSPVAVGAAGSLPRTPAPSAPEFFTADEVATMLRVDIKTVYQVIQSGELRAVRIGKKRLVRVTREALESFAQARVTLPEEDHGSET